MFCILEQLDTDEFAHSLLYVQIFSALLIRRHRMRTGLRQISVSRNSSLRLISNHRRYKHFSKSWLKLTLPVLHHAGVYCIGIHFILEVFVNGEFVGGSSDIFENVLRLRSCSSLLYVLTISIEMPFVGSSTWIPLTDALSPWILP